MNALSPIRDIGLSKDGQTRSTEASQISRFLRISTRYYCALHLSLIAYNKEMELVDAWWLTHTLILLLLSPSAKRGKLFVCMWWTRNCCILLWLGAKTKLFYPPSDTSCCLSPWIPNSSIHHNLSISIKGDFSPFPLLACMKALSYSCFPINPVGRSLSHMWENTWPFFLSWKAFSE